MTVQFGEEVELCGMKKSVRERGWEGGERHSQHPGSAISWLSWKQSGRQSLCGTPAWAVKCTDHLCPGEGEATLALSPTIGPEL